MRLRPPILFTLVYGAGLATGLARFSEPGDTILSAAVCATAFILRRRPLVALLAAAALFGRLSGAIAWWREGDRCAARLPAAEMRLTVRTLEPADLAGGLMSVQPLRAACVDAVTARWPRGRAIAAGREVEVTSRWVPRRGPLGRPSGMLVVRTAGEARGDPDLSARLRNGVVHATGTLYGRRAPIVDALVLGLRSSMDREVKDHFAQSGLVHLLSISGFHVGLIASWVFLLCRLARMSRSRAAVVAAVIGTAYVAFLGWPAPATPAPAL
jgi:competence protein ComEC